jgi:hypothetical protein
MLSVEKVRNIFDEMPLVIEGKLHFVSTDTPLGRLALERFVLRCNLARKEREAQQLQEQLIELQQTVDALIIDLDPER